MNRIFRFITIVLILCIVFVTGCSKGPQELIVTVSPKLTNTIKTLKFKDIKYAKIQLGTAGANPIKYYVFDFNNPVHTKVIKDVVHYLNSDKIQGNAYKQIVNYKGGSPQYLILVLKDESVIEIKYAIHDTVKKNLDGSTETAKNPIPNEVTINIINSNEKSIRILSPEIKKIIDSGYKDIFKWVAL